MDWPTVEESMPFVPKSGIPKPIPDKRQPYQKQLAMVFILASILFERAAFYSLANNLVVNLDSDELLDWKPSHSSIASFIFSGVTHIATLIFAVISDAKIGRARTIIAGFVMYLAGYILAILVTNPNINMCTPSASNETSATTIIKEPCAGWILTTLVIIALGAGAVQSNMAVFGAEQKQRSHLTSRYFDHYMIAVNMGGIIGTLAISFIQIDTKSYFIGYLVAASMLLIAFLLFIIGYRYYIHAEPYDTVIAMCIPIIISAFQSWRKSRQQRSSANRSEDNISSMPLSDASVNIENSLRVSDRSSTSLNLSNAVNSGKFTHRMVDDVKSLGGTFVVFSLLIPYFLIYSQMSSTFPLQGEHMRRPSDVKNIVTLMSLGDPVTIVIGILILYVVYKFLDVQHRPSTIAAKFVIGMCFASIVMCAAGVVEVFRRDQCDQEKDESSLSVYFLLLLHILMGLSELFAMVASYEFAYFAAPRSAQSLFMSLRFVSIGISSFMGSGFIAAFPTTSFNLDFSCRIEQEMNWGFYTYFYILGGLQLVFVIIFIVCQKKFQIVKMNPQQTEIDGST